MSNIVFCNTNISDIKYSGYTISKIYACGGQLVYEKNAITIPPQWKERFEYNDGTVYYGGANFSTSGNVSYNADFSTYVYTYSGGNYVYAYDSYHRDIYTNASALTISKNVDTISANTFSGCTSLKTVDTSGCTNECSIITIGDGAFKHCEYLEYANITYGVKKIGNEAFYRCHNLKEIIMGEVEEIGQRAFYECDSTSNHRIVLPSTLRKIGIQAFYGCSNLNEVLINRTTPPSMSSVNAFSNCASNLKIYVPASAVETYKTSNDWYELADIIYPM